MPRFDVNVWKALHPASTEGSGIVAAIKEWQVHCPDKYDVPNADPKRLVGAVTPAAKKFLTAIADAESKLAKDKSTDAETKAKIAKTKVMLAKWKIEVTNYQKEVTKWWQDSIKEASEDQKRLAQAQLAFTTALVDGMQVALSKMPALAKKFDAILKSPRIEDAAPVLREHRDLLTKALYLVKPVALASERHRVAAKFKVDAVDLKLPPKIHELAKKLDAMSTLDDDMQDRFERALEGDIDDDADPGAASGPEYRKNVRDLATACQSNAAKTKVKMTVATQILQSVKQIRALPADNPASLKGIAGIRTLNQKMLATFKEMKTLREEAYRRGSKREQDAIACKLTPADVAKFLTPPANLATTYTKRFVLTCEEASDLMEDWLGEVLAANPASADAKSELAKVKARQYSVQLS